MQRKEILAEAIGATANVLNIARYRVNKDTKISSEVLPKVKKKLNESLIGPCKFQPWAMLGPLTVEALVRAVILN